MDDLARSLRHLMGSYRKRFLFQQTMCLNLKATTEAATHQQAQYFKNMPKIESHHCTAKLRMLIIGNQAARNSQNRAVKAV